MQIDHNQHEKLEKLRRQDLDKKDVRELAVMALTWHSVIVLRSLCRGACVEVWLGVQQRLRRPIDVFKAICSLL